MKKGLFGCLFLCSLVVQKSYAACQLSYNPNYSGCNGPAVVTSGTGTCSFGNNKSVPAGSYICGETWCTNSANTIFVAQSISMTNKKFYCVCKSGYYGDVSTGNDSSCTACPSGGTSSATNGALLNPVITNTEEGDCYSSTEKDVSYGTSTKKCYWSNAFVSTRICEGNICKNYASSSYKPACCYGDYNVSCTETLKTCDAGYYRASSSDLYCTAVGGEYYSSNGSLSRTRCPTYTNPSGGTSYGKTTGSGTGADAITDCKLPNTEVFSETAGSFVFENCYYVQ